MTKHMSQLDGCCRYGTDRCWNCVQNLGYSAHLGHHVAPDRAVAVDVETGHLRAYPAVVTGLSQLQAAAGLLVI